MEWNNKYAIGIPEIDEQHKVLFACIERLEAPADAQQHGLSMYYVMEQLKDFVRIHFAVEEIVMRLFDYPELEAHAAEHRAFSAKIEALEKDELSHEVHIQVGKFLREWLLRHVMVSDKHYAAYILGKGVLPD